jgi:hypothetical protein
MLGCRGAFNDSEACDYTYANIADRGREMYVTPGVVIDGEFVTTDLVDIKPRHRIPPGSSFTAIGRMAKLSSGPAARCSARKAPCSASDLVARPQAPDIS